MVWNPSMIVFLMMVFLSLGLMLSTESYFLSWISLELNSLSFLPWLLLERSKINGEAMLKYFFIQSLGSILFLFGILVYVNFDFKDWSVMYLFLIYSSLFMKLGAAPFHSWVPSVAKSLSFYSLFLLLSIQKINPLIMVISLSYFYLLWNYWYFIVTIGLILGALLGLSCVQIRPLLIYSSINHLGWILSMVQVSNLVLIIYFFIYSMILLSVIYFFDFTNLFTLVQMSDLKMSFLKLFFFSLLFLSLGGLPPLLGFLPKWMILQELVSSNLIFLSLLMILTSLVTLFYYLRLTLNNLMMSKFDWQAKSESETKLTKLIYFSIWGLPLSILFM